MAVDPAVYALSIQLQLEATDAFKTFDDFGKRVTDLEEQVSTAAQKAIQGIQDISLQATTQLDAISGLLKDVTAESMRIQTNLIDAGKELKDQYDTGEDRLEDVEEELKHWENVLKLQEDIGAELTEHLKLNQGFLKLMDRVIAAVKKKNVGHSTQNDLLAKDIDLVGGVNKGLDTSAKKSKELAKQWAKITAAWRSINSAIKAAVADEEKFVTVNYRAYGAQQSLLQQTRELGMAFDILQTEALEAYVALGALKVPKEQLEEYTKMVARASRTTGASVQTTADYVNKLRTAGMNAQMTEKSLAHLGEAMRKYGLNTRDVNALMNQSAANTKNAARIFGSAPEELEKWEESRRVMAGFARQAGHGAEEMAGFEQWILNDVAALEVLKARSNTTEKGIDGYRLAVMRAGIENYKQMEAWQTAVDNQSMSSEEFKAQQESLISVYYGGNRAAFEASLAQGKLAKNMNLTGASIEEVNKLTEQYTKTLEEQASEANDTFTRQVAEMKDSIKALFGTLLQLMADALLPIIKALNWFIRGIGSAIKWFSGLMRKLEEFSPVTRWIVQGLKWVAGAALVLVAVIVILGGAFLSFLAVVASFLGLFGGLSGLLARMSGLILGVARALGQGFIIIMTSIGQGLAALGNAVKPVMLPLLALGAAILMVGIGAFFFAMAVQRVAETGWAAIPAMIGLIITIGILGLVLILLAKMVKGPVMLGLIILAAAILAVGLAALMAGAGIYLAALGIQILAGSLSFKLIAMMATLGLALIILGLAGLTSAPGILLMGLAMVVLGGAALVVAKAFQVMGVSLRDISAQALPELGRQLFEFGVLFIAASAMILAGAVMLVPGAAMLLAGMAMLIPAGAMMVVAGAALWAGVKVMEKGSSRLEGVGAQVLAGGTGMMVGGGNLVIGVNSLREATGSLLGQGLRLVLAAKLLGTGAVAMIPAASLLMLVGAMVMAGGITFFRGVEVLATAAPMLVTAATILQAAAGILLPAAVQLADGGFAIFLAGISLLIGASLLTAAALPLAIGLALLDGSADEVMNVGMKIGRGGTQMLMGAQGLVGAASLLRNSAEHIQSGLDVLASLMPRLSDLAASLYGPSRDLMSAAMRLEYAGYLLQPAAHMIYRGLMWLDFAVSKFAKTIDEVEVVSAAVASLAASFIALQKTPLTGLRELTENALEAVPNIEQLGDRLVVAAKKLDTGVTAIEGPANRLGDVLHRAVAKMDVGAISLDAPATRMAEMLVRASDLLDDGVAAIEGPVTRLGEVMAAISGTFEEGTAAIEMYGILLGLAMADVAIGLDASAAMADGPALRLSDTMVRAAAQLGVGVAAFASPVDHLGELAAMIDDYAALIEGAAERIEIAIATKAVPAMKAAAEAGIEESVRSEAITTVKMLTESEGDSATVDPQEMLLAKSNELLKSLDDRLALMGGGNKEIVEILALLQAYLPNVTKGDSGLGNEMNSWAK